jgi:hypothetical protein
MKLNHILLSLALTSAPATAFAGETCAYVFGTIGGETVTTPAIPVFVPASELTVDPIRVHVDATTIDIVGYDINIPGLDTQTNRHDLYVPALSWEIPSLSATLPELDVNISYCISAGASVPAVPVYIPDSVFTLPGAVIETPTISLNVAGLLPLTVPGKVITIDGRTIVLTGVSVSTPPVSVSTPEDTITVDINGTLHTVTYLLPPS